jgi:conjugative transfer signal peptidase TraF
MTTRMATLIAAVTAVAALSSTILSRPAPRLIWNASESVPVGLYSVHQAGKLVASDLVVAFPPEPLASLLARGAYLPVGLPLVKRIVALSGQFVCRDQLRITIDGIEVGMAQARDHRGVQLPDWQGCRTLSEGEVFLMNWDEPLSFDSRYFGPIPATAIVGRAQPLWMIDED